MVLSQAWPTAAACSSQWFTCHRTLTDICKQTRDVISQLGLRRRGCRAGKHHRRSSLAARVATSSIITKNPQSGLIPSIVGNRRSIDSTARHYNGDGERQSVLTAIRRCRQRQHVRFGLFNARSVGNKCASVQQWIADTKLNVAAIVETWHDDASSPDLIGCTPPGFRYVETARQRSESDKQSLKVNHGGVSLFYDRSLSANPCQLRTFTSFEVVAAYIHRSGFNAVVIVIYRPGSQVITQSFFDDFNNLLESISTFSTSLIILGDLNVHVDDPSNVHGRKLLNVLSSYNFTQHVNVPTHLLGHTLDLVMTRTNLSVTLLPVDPPSLSDHAFVVAEVDCQSLSCQSFDTRIVRNWRSLDVDALATDLCCSELVLKLPDDVDAAFACYDTTLRSLVDKHAPLRTKRISHRTTARWFDDECRASKRRTRKLERKYRHLLTSAAQTAWRDQFRCQRSLYEQKFVSYWCSTVDDCRNNPRALWRVVKELMESPQQSPTSKFSAVDFATFCRSKVANIRSSTATVPPPDIQARQSASLTAFIPVTEDEIQSILASAPPTSCPLDPLPTWLLKKLAPHITPVICNLCNLSLQTGSFPSCLKRALVYPRIKKSNMDPDSLSSYRPISNLSYISKVLERIVAKRFTSHANESNLFPVHQSAYRAHHSTETAVLSVHNALIRSIDSGNVSMLVLLDLSAAFDTVDHNILLSVLNTRFSINGTALDWFRSYLSGRTQSIVYGGHQTDDYPVDCSVPQGSVMGPLEFIAYTEDGTDTIKQHEVQSHSYADDTQLHASSSPNDVSSVRQRMSDCASDFMSWCAARRLQLNADKTEVMWVGSRHNLSKLVNQNLALTIGTETIEPVAVVRDLGVWLDNELSLKHHVAKVASACFYQLRRLRQIRRRAGREVTIRLVLALVTSRLDYCNSLLAGLPNCTLDVLQRVQNASARLICQLKPRDHISTSLQDLHWLPIRYRVQYKLCTLMYTIHKGQSPAYLSHEVITVATQTLRSGLRSANTTNYSSPRLLTKFGERAFSHAGPAAWNSLPHELRAAPSLNSFKRKLKTHLFNTAFNL